MTTILANAYQDFFTANNPQEQFMNQNLRAIETIGGAYQFVLTLGVFGLVFGFIIVGAQLTSGNALTKKEGKSRLSRTMWLGILMFSLGSLCSVAVTAAMSIAK